MDAWGPLDRPNADALVTFADAAMYAEKVANKQAVAALVDSADH